MRQPLSYASTNKSKGFVLETATNRTSRPSPAVATLACTCLKLSATPAMSNVPDVLEKSCGEIRAPTKESFVNARDERVALLTANNANAVENLTIAQQ
mmetsp:Transcript_20139/g.29889  ORF Transcript_20139/g.29889 Transcript_20139/m.29889 type:complete len:98 (-) Transcript_20139:38-331(-)